MPTKMSGLDSAREAGVSMGTCGMMGRGIHFKLTDMREHRPIYPSDGQAYTDAITSAEDEYKTWLEARKDQVGLQLFAIRKSKKENTYGVRSVGIQGGVSFHQRTDV